MRYRLVLTTIAAVVAFGWTPAAAAPPPGTSKVKAATVTPTLSGVKYQLRSFGRWRTEHVGDLAAEAEDGLSGDLLLALASRETGLRNIVGGGFFDPTGEFQVTGVDRGLWQVNQVFHAVWLRSVPGCDSGTYREIHLSGSEGGTGALPSGRVPGLSRAELYVIFLLQRNVAYATASGVPAEDAVQVAVAAHNAGAFNAVRGYREGQIDRFTTGLDYSSNVLKRRSLMRRARKALGFR